MNETVAIENVKVGMFLTDIAESTSDLQVKSRGLIKSSSTIASLQKRGVLAIVIDLEKSIHLDASTSYISAEEPKKSSTSQIKMVDKPLSFEEQQAFLAKADKLYTQARSVQSRFVKQVRSGEAPDFAALNSSCQDIIDSIFEEPQALACLIMLKNTNEYLVEHSLNCSILLGLFGKHLDFSQSEIEDLTLSGLLMDIGMSLLPPDLLNRTQPYSSADRVLMQSHIDIASEIIERHEDLPPMIRDVIHHHHQRLDDTGYPKLKTESEMSIYAKMAAIVDSYDAMISKREYLPHKSPQEALEELLENPGYDTSLVESFIEAIGLYPVGSLVHLKSGKLAIVVRQHKPLKPKVMSFYNIRTKHHTDVKLIDLSRSTDKILGAVHPEAFKLDLPKFFKTVLFQS